jgi:hypothetical protein
MLSHSMQSVSTHRNHAKTYIPLKRHLKTRKSQCLANPLVFHYSLLMRNQGCLVFEMLENTVCHI